MARDPMERIAREVVSTKKRLDALARSRQLPATSVTLDDGEEQDLTNVLIRGADAWAGVGAIDEHLTDIGDIADDSAVGSTFLPDQVAAAAGSADAGYDTGIVAWERAQEAKAEIESTRVELEGRLTDLDLDLVAAEGRLAEAQARADAAFGAAESRGLPVVQDTAPAGVEIRRNVVLAPRGTAARAGNWASMTARSTELTGGPEYCPQWGKGVVSAATSSSLTYWTAGTGLGGTPVVGGQTYELGMSVYSSRATDNRIAIYQYRADGSLISADSTIFPLLPISAGEWIRREATWTAPADCAHVLLEVHLVAPSGGWAAGDIIGYTASAVSSGTGGYFDGGYAPGRTYSTAWTGPANASVSVLSEWEVPPSQILWIDTSGGANTPMRWDGTSWVEITDKTAKDAAADAAVAHETASSAQGAADTAKAAADAAAVAALEAADLAAGGGAVLVQDTAPTVTEVRRNYIKGSSPLSGNMIANFASTSRSVVTDPLGIYGQVIQVVTTGTAGGITQNVATGSNMGAAEMPAGAGTFTALFRAPAGALMRVGVQEYSPTITPRGENFLPWAAATGNWQEVTLPYTVTAADSRTRIAVQAQNPVTFWVGGVSGETGATPGGIILPGYPSPDPLLTPAWTGPANASPSVLLRGPVRLDRILWIDTTSGANTPKRWNGSIWTEVTDKAAKDAATAAASAASAAATAQSKADAAHTLAGTAQSNAQSALTMAGTKGKVYYSTSAPAGEATAQGDLWRQIDDTSKDVLAEWYWTGTAWQSSKITTTAIANLDVGKLVVGTGIISDLVAQHIAGRTASFQTVDVNNIFVTGQAVIQEAVIEALWAQVVKARFLIATEQIITKDVIAEGTISASKLASDVFQGNTFIGNTFVGGTVSGSFFELSGYGNNVLRLSDPMTSVTPWTATDGATRALDSLMFRSSPTSMRITRGTSTSPTAGAYRNITVPAGKGAEAVFWVYSPTAMTVSANFWNVQFPNRATETYVPAGAWTEVRFSAESPSATQSWTRLYIKSGGGLAPAYFCVDDLAVSSTDIDNRKLSILRDESGGPQVYGNSGEWHRFKLYVGEPPGGSRGGSLAVWNNEGTVVTGYSGTGVNMSDSVGERLTITNGGMRWPKPSTFNTEIQSNSATGFLIESMNASAPLTLKSTGNDIALSANAVTSDRALKVLWSGEIFMNGSQVAPLSDLVTNQLSGIVLVWSRYPTGGPAANDSWTECFVPKHHVTMNVTGGSRGIYMTGTTGFTSGGDWKKYIYISNDQITGNASNSVAPNTNVVLRYVLGV